MRINLLNFDGYNLKDGFLSRISGLVNPTTAYSATQIGTSNASFGIIL